MKGQLMWEVTIQNKSTNEKTHILVPADTNEQATRLARTIYDWGYDGEYQWEGTGPAYSNDGKRIIIQNQMESRFERKAQRLISNYEVALSTLKEIQEEYKNKSNEYMEGFCGGSAKSYTQVIVDFKNLLEKVDTQ